MLSVDVEGLELGAYRFASIVETQEKDLGIFVQQAYVGIFRRVYPE
jgi:hypothetical protein